MSTAQPHMPVRSDYRHKFAFSSLPFVNRAGKRFEQWSNWNVPDVQDYGEACALGAEYAAHYVQYLKSNPGMAGSSSLAEIASAIDFKDQSHTKGFRVGFFAYLEKMILGGVRGQDVYEAVDGYHAMYMNIEVRRREEEAA